MGISAPSRDGPYSSRARLGCGAWGDTDVHIQACAAQRTPATGVLTVQGRVPGAGSFLSPQTSPRRPAGLHIRPPRRRDGKLTRLSRGKEEAKPEFLPAESGSRASPSPPRAHLSHPCSWGARNARSPQPRVPGGVGSRPREVLRVCPRGPARASTPARARASDTFAHTGVRGPVCTPSRGAGDTAERPSSHK